VQRGNPGDLPQPFEQLPLRAACGVPVHELCRYKAGATGVGHSTTVNHHRRITTNVSQNTSRS
jgi:hypothetical protein